MSSVDVQVPEVQFRVYWFIRSRIEETGRSPTLDEISSYLGNSTRTRGPGARLVKKLIKLGLIYRRGHALHLVGVYDDEPAPVDDSWVTDDCTEWQPGDPTPEEIQARAAQIRQKRTLTVQTWNRTINDRGGRELYPVSIEG
ncbi:MAG: hypothetical protein AAF456_22555 [Planctomycetota bacterium]